MDVSELSHPTVPPQPPPSSPSLPWRTRITLRILDTITAASSRRDGTVNRTLLNFFSYTYRCKPCSDPIGGVSSHDVTVDPTRNLWFRLFVPAAVAPLPIIVFFHGGGFAYLSADNKSYDAVCRRFARKCDAVVVSVNYRLAPEHRFPAQYDDGFDVLRFLDDEVSRRKGGLPENADLSRCFLAGDSAGANLAHHVGMRACNSDRHLKRLQVSGVVAIQPFFGGEERTEAEINLSRVDPLISIARTDWLWKAFLPPGKGMDRDHEAINVSGPRAVDLSKLEFPATIVVVGGFDSLKDWQKRYYEWLKKSGKEVYLLEYPNMVHAFYIFPELKESTDLIAKVKDFINKQCSKVAKI